MSISFSKPARPPDFEDCFSAQLAYPQMSPRDLAALAVASSPDWFRALFALRQRLAKLVGLKSENEDGENPGVGFLLSLPKVQDDANAYEAGLADRHLDFSIRVEKHNGQVNLITRIWFNNLAGRVYLAVVKPFHNLIVSHWLKRLEVQL